MKPDHARDIGSILARLHRNRARARAILLFERIWPALWPGLGVLGLLLCAALLELPSFLPPLSRIAAISLTLMLSVVLFARGLRRLRRPTDRDADRRLEQTNQLQHNPLQVIGDAPSQQDAVAQALWQAHIRAAHERIRRLRISGPRPGLAARDPRALRGGLIVLIAASLAIAGPSAPGRLAALFDSGAFAALMGEPLSVQGWITPPAYTNLPPILVGASADTIAVPVGSHLTVAVANTEAPPAFNFAGADTPFQRIDTSSWQAERDIAQGGKLTISAGWRTAASWTVKLIPDNPPDARWNGTAGPASRGNQIRLPWQAEDDYGVASLQAEITLQARPETPPLIISIPLQGTARKSLQGAFQQDLTAHPWAGLGVTAKLVARDAIGQTGESAPQSLTLPMRRFQNALSRQLLSIRQALTIHPEARLSAARSLDGIGQGAPEFARDFGATVNLGAVIGDLEHERGADAIANAQAGLWDLALHFEEGSTERSARALDAARRAAEDALNKAKRDPTEANRAELERKLQELREATNDYLNALREDAKRDPSEVPFDRQDQTQTERDLQQLNEDARQSAEDGKLDDAGKKLAELEQKLDQLQRGQMQHRGNAQAERNRQRGRQEMSALQDMVIREGKLLDQAQGRLGTGFDDPTDPRAMPRRGQRPPAASVPDETANAARDGEARIQHALRRALGELMQQFGDLTGKIPPGLSDADTAMSDAETALKSAQDDSASHAEQRAIEALQESGQQMSQQLSQQFGRGDGDQSGEDDGEQMGQSGEDGQNGDPRNRGTGRNGQAQLHRRDRLDPLGRENSQGGNGADEGDGVQLPAEAERQRTRDLQDELRRRGAERSRPQEELDYIDRLLKQF
jgi:uncharacterized protein (TIGR02302 family)